MTDPAAILRDLAYAKAVFQLRAIKAALGVPPTPRDPLTQAIADTLEAGECADWVARQALQVPASDNSAGSLGSAPGALPSGADPALGVRK